MKNNKKILIKILIAIVIIGISLFIFNNSQDERCSWKVTDEDIEKYAELGPIWSMIAGFEFDEKQGCIPIGGSKYVEGVVPFKTKEECESICKLK